MNIEIANRLVELRKKNGFSQEELAARLGISRQAVSKWERAESCPDTDNLICLSRLYHVSLDGLLLTGEEEEATEAEEAAEDKEKERQEESSALESPGGGSLPEGASLYGNVDEAGGKGTRASIPRPETAAEDGGEKQKRPEAPSEEENAEKGGEEGAASHRGPLPREREVYDAPDGSRVETCRTGDEVVVTVTDPQGRSVTVIEREGRKSLHFDGLDPSDPETEELLKKFRIQGTEIPGWNGMGEPLESFDGVPVKQKDKKKKRKKGGRFEGSFPVLCALIYLLLGFLGDLWHPGWLIFLTIPIYYTFVGCIHGAGGFKTAVKATWPVCCAMVFLALGGVWNLWHPGWLIFLTVPIIECL